MPRQRILVLALAAMIGALAWGRVTPNQGARAPHRLWERSIQPNADSAPAYSPRVRLAGGRTRSLVYVLAGNNTSNCDPGDPVRRATLYAFDASSGRTIWTRSTSGPSRCTTAGPAVDPSGGWVYAPGLDGKVHRYAAGSGKESRALGFPHPVTLMPDVEKVSATLTVSGRYLYVTTSGFIGDQGHYQGHLVTIDLGTGHTHVFNSLCSNIHALLGGSSSARKYCQAERSGLFGRGEGVVDPLNHDVYIVSGNGPWNGQTNWGDSILKLDSSGARLLDSYTPDNQATLADQDLDLGSTGPALLPAVRQGGHAYHLLVQGGKGPACDSCSGTALRLLNRDRLSGRKGVGHLGGDLQDIASPCGQEVLTAPAVWTAPNHATWVFYANDCGLAGYRLTVHPHATFRLVRGWSAGTGGTTPVVAGNTLYVARKGEIRAYSLTSHALLWRTTDIGDIHWEYPLVTGGRLFMTDEADHVIAYRL